MPSVLDKNLFLVKEQVGLFKASNSFDIFDPATGKLILEAREPSLGSMTKIFRFTNLKRQTPFLVEIREPNGALHAVVYRGVSFVLSKVSVEDGKGRLLGFLKQKFFSVGGAFRLLSPEENELAQLSGSWTGWDFRFTAGGFDLATITKKWAGIGKELFTSADNYMIEISDRIQPGNPVRALILGAMVTIDMVFKE